MIRKIISSVSTITHPIAHRSTEKVDVVAAEQDQTILIGALNTQQSSHPPHLSHGSYFTTGSLTIASAIQTHTDQGTDRRACNA